MKAVLPPSIIVLEGPLAPLLPEECKHGVEVAPCDCGYGGIAVPWGTIEEARKHRAALVAALLAAPL